MFDQILNKEIALEEDEWKMISNEAKDLIKKILIREPSERIIIPDILKHSWFKGYRSSKKLLSKI